MKKIILCVLFLTLGCSVNQNGNYASVSNSYSPKKTTKKYKSNSFFSRNYNASYLSNKSDGEITRMIGEPDIKRFDHPTQTWLYQRENGTLFLFFEQQNDKNVVKHIEARNRIDDNKVDSDEFLRRSF